MGTKKIFKLKPCVLSIHPILAGCTRDAWLSFHPYIKLKYLILCVKAAFLSPSFNSAREFPAAPSIIQAKR